MSNGETDSRGSSHAPVVIKDPLAVKTMKWDRKNKHAEMQISSLKAKDSNFLNII